MDRERQLVVLCDGTSNTITGGDRDTNVLKLTNFLGHHDAGQMVFYDPGVGNPGGLLGVTLWDWFARYRDRILGLALGRGVYDNVAESYLFLMRNYRHVPDEGERGKIFIFGFSRGAFTARSVAGMVRMFGILPAHLETLVPTLMSIYFAKRDSRSKQRLVSEIRSKFSRPATVHFVGVWDTVASVGLWPFALRIPASPTIAGKEILHVRQALALDEHRAPFKPRIYGDANGPVGDTGHTMEQRWFRGAHCDIGGGYEVEDCLVSHEALAWIMDEARGKGLRLWTGTQPLGSLAEIKQAITTVAPGVPRPPVAHSETRGNSLWAIAGLTVRDPRAVDWAPEDSAARKEEFQPADHPSVAPPLRAYPGDTVWKDSRGAWRWIRWIIGIGIVALASSAMSDYLTPVPAKTLCNLPAWLERLGVTASASNCFVQWQLAWWFDGDLHAFRDFRRPVAALMLDFVNILAYGFVLSWPMVWAFARRAGLRRAQMGPPRVLNALGRSLKYMVVADLAENVATLLLMCLAIHGYFFAALVAGIAMSLAAAVKFAGLAGVLALLAWGLAPPPKPA